MPIVKADCFEMDRRQFTRIVGSMGIGATFLNPYELYAQGQCKQIYTGNGEVQANQAGATLQYWIDGLHFPKNNTDLPSRANITLFMDLKQTAVAHVEAVVLMDENKNTISARYFDASMKMTDGHVPYVRFENVHIDENRKYYCVYTVRSGSNIQLFISEIKDPATGKPTVSRLNTTWLPDGMRNDFKTFLAGNKQNPTPGLITSQFQFYTHNGLASHTARGKMTDIGSDGSFNCAIDFMHGDVNTSHYMRYFIVMDPVGRLLGVVKRNLPGDEAGGKVNGSVTNVGKLDAATIAQFGIAELQVADIRDCPYIQFYTEDCYDALARNIIRLR